MRVDTSKYTPEYIGVMREVALAKEKSLFRHDHIRRHFEYSNLLTIVLQEETDLYIKRASGPSGFYKQITITIAGNLEKSTLRKLMQLKILHEGKLYEFHDLDAEVETTHYAYEEEASRSGVIEANFHPKEIVE